MTVITRSSHPSSLWPGVKAFFGKTYKEIPMQCDMIFTEESSGKAYEEAVESTTFGYAPIKNEGQAISYDTDGEGYKNRATHAVYGLGYIVTREEIEDNQYESRGKSRARSLAFSMRQTKEVVHAGIFNTAFSTTYGDGAALCSTAHPTLAGNKANKASVDAALSEAALEDAQIDLFLYTNSRGLRIQVSPKKLIVPPQLSFVAKRLLSSDKQPGTANNDINATKAMGLISEDFVNYRYLSNSTAWFLQTDIPQGFTRYQRRAMELQQDNDFDTENAKAKATERYVCTVNDWRAVWGSDGAP
jgi:hypothetical protein